MIDVPDPDLPEHWIKHLKEVRAMAQEHILTFANIMEAEDITETTVPVPEWGGSVVVRSLSYNKMGKIKEKIADQAGSSVDDIDLSGSEMEQALIVAGMIDPVVDEDQAALLMEKSSGAVMKVLSAIMSAGKTTDAAVKEEEKSVSTEPGKVLPLPPSGKNVSNRPRTTHRKKAPTK